MSKSADIDEEPASVPECIMYAEAEPDSEETVNNIEW